MKKQKLNHTFVGMNNDDKVRSWIKFACDTCGVPDLTREIKFIWNKRFTRKLGDANCKKRLIRLSIPLWSLLDEAGHIHETCHIIAGVLHVKPQSHGKEWKALMRKCGLSPSSFTKLDRGNLRRRQRVRVYCGCTEKFVPKGKRTKMLSGKYLYTCLQCGEHISPVPYF